MRADDTLLDGGAAFSPTKSEQRFLAAALAAGVPGIARGASPPAPLDVLTSVMGTT